MSILKNYASSLILIIGIILGGTAGIVFGSQTEVVKPIGDLFLNMMFVLIVPLVFFSVSSAICNIRQEGELVGKLIASIVIVFMLTAIVAASIAYMTTQIFNPFSEITLSDLQITDFTDKSTDEMSAGEMLVKTLTVPDFIHLLSKNNLLPLIIFSIFFGISVSKLGKQGEVISRALSATSQAIMKMMGLIMYAAPIGLGCYFAYTIGQLGEQILNGYLYAFILYLILAFICYFILNSIYAFISAGKNGFIIFWKNILTPSLAAIATSSSAACIPVNLTSAKNMGIPDEIAETVLPLGANMHKDGSIIGGVLKIVFLIAIFGNNTPLASNIFIIIGMAILVGAVMGAIPSGGMTGELLICSVFGFPLEMVGALMIISTIIDTPATLVNSTGNIACSMLVARFTLGKGWLAKQKERIR